MNIRTLLEMLDRLSAGALLLDKQNRVGWVSNHLLDSEIALTGDEISLTDEEHLQSVRCENLRNESNFQAVLYQVEELQLLIIEEDVRSYDPIALTKSITQDLVIPLSNVANELVELLPPLANNPHVYCDLSLVKRTTQKLNAINANAANLWYQLSIGEGQQTQPEDRLTIDEIILEATTPLIHRASFYTKIDRNSGVIYGPKEWIVTSFRTLCVELLQPNSHTKIRISANQSSTEVIIKIEDIKSSETYGFSPISTHIQSVQEPPKRIPFSLARGLIEENGGKIKILKSGSVSGYLVTFPTGAPAKKPEISPKLSHRITTNYEDELIL